MTTFAQAFWSSDYAGGLGVLFGKLQQGVHENQQLLTISRMRADAEDLYGQHIHDIGPACDRITDGFSKDDGASVRKAYDGVRVEMEEASIKHRKIASNIRELVVYPFGRWCDQHAARVQNSQDDLQARIKAHDRQAEIVRKLRSHYFNKCRLVEDLEEEDKLAFKEPASSSSPPVTSPKVDTPTVKIQEPDEDEEDITYEIGDDVFQKDQMRKILVHMLSNIRLGETKVPILGTYSNVSTGSEIVEYIQKHMNGSSVSYAERIGQDLITNGFLRLVGNVGNVFANSSRMNYQWRPKVFQVAELPEHKPGLNRSNTVLSSDSIGDNPYVNNLAEYVSGWNPLNNPYPNETPAQKLRRESREADDRYKAGVRKLDLLRCTLEEAIFEHLKFMERCELDRLKAIKSVILDFSGAISNVIPSLQSTIDKMMLFQETVQPLGDLRYMLESYRTGPFVPRVQPYENYYNSVDEQTFGIDLEARARSDRKRVPLIVTTILTHLDNSYPLLDGDEARRSIWVVDVPLAATHRLRAELNTGKGPTLDQLSKYEVPIVASCLKLYLLELPDSIVSSGLYEIIKTIYSTPSTSGADETAVNTRISVLQNTLGQLRLANIATLDAITTHFARLLDLTSADEAYTTMLVQLLAPCILRSRNETSLLFEEKYNIRFLRDLLSHKDTIFNELKRTATLQHSASVARAQSTLPHGHSSNSSHSNQHHNAHHPSLNLGDSSTTFAASSLRDSIIPPGASSAFSSSRGRAISSTDESNRRAHTEERNRAIAAGHRSRASSPAPGTRELHLVSGSNNNNGGPVQGHSGHVRSSSHQRGAAAARHRRDSSRGADTRFPVAAPTSNPSSGAPGGTSSPRTSIPTTAGRNSLDVPGSGPGSPAATMTSHSARDQHQHHHQTGNAASGGPGSGSGSGSGQKDLPALPPPSSSSSRATAGPTPAISSSLANTSAYYDTGSDTDRSPPPPSLGSSGGGAGGVNGHANSNSGAYVDAANANANANASADSGAQTAGEVGKSNSLGRSRAVARKGGAAGGANRDSAGSLTSAGGAVGGRGSLDAQRGGSGGGGGGGGGARGVTLEDRAMDD